MILTLLTYDAKRWWDNNMIKDNYYLMVLYYFW